jgi:hypothetical protein
MTWKGMTTNDTNESDGKRTERLLKRALPPASLLPRATLQLDLWAAMRQRLDQRPVRVPWFDWALLAAVVVWLAIFPRAIPVLLYHL